MMTKAKQRRGFSDRRRVRQAPPGVPCGHRQAVWVHRKMNKIDPNKEKEDNHESSNK